MARNKELKIDLQPEKIKVKFTANCIYKFLKAKKDDIIELEKSQAEFCLNRGKCRII